VVQVLAGWGNGVEVDMGSQVQEMAAVDDTHLEAGDSAGHRLLQAEDIDSRDEWDP
jgi:hypothetical protein